MTEHSTYAQVREQNELGILPSSSTASSAYNGPAPMEIDRFEKGKKGKGKQKSKDSSFSKGKD
jgi:hypothetical protein